MCTFYVKIYFNVKTNEFQAPNISSNDELKTHQKCHFKFETCFGNSILDFQIELNCSAHQRTERKSSDFQREMSFIRHSNGKINELKSKFNRNEIHLQLYFDVQTKQNHVDSVDSFYKS